MNSTVEKSFADAAELQNQGRFGEAAAIYRRILADHPDHADALNLLGVTLAREGNVEEATRLMHRAVEMNPDAPVYRNNLGLALTTLGRLDQAVASFEQAIALAANYAEAYSNLGNALTMQHRYGKAIEFYRDAVGQRPDFAQAFSNMSTPLTHLGRHEEAIAAAKRGSELRPNHAGALCNMGFALESAGQLDEALAAYRRALQLRPDLGRAYVAIGNILKTMGRIDEAVAALNRAVEIEPGSLEANSSLAYLVYFHADYDASAILRAQRRWSERFAEPLAGEIRQRDVERSPERRLRIGYVSADFRIHSVGRFLLPLMENHDHETMEIYCYSDVPVPDAITRRLRACADEWLDVEGMADAVLAEKIREHKIDILIDLSLQTAGNRLLVFARKPAAVQATYLGYCGTSGMGAMDWRITDPYLDPMGMDESCYSERSIRLGVPYWCYEAHVAMDPQPPPVLRSGRITFGCLNTYAKISAPAWRAWERLLLAVPNSRLRVHSNPGSHWKDKKSEIAAAGIDPERLEFVPGLAAEDYFREYQGIDIGLDPFPYGGGTTTCDALWMGVPVVTVAGRTAVGRGGVSLLSQIGLGELIGADEGEYVGIAAELAGDWPRLTEMRRGLRERMAGSAVMKGADYARGVERAYREMWRDFCRTAR
ncbi:MAG: tetratricopeptide repeat protein [Tepidisphaeraceae bacterium]|jgi:predicted O-linked N-acetylglucosamine transferase (SPINDLY family)